MRKNNVLFASVLSLALAGCQSRVVKYTSEDAREYALKKANTTSAKMIAVQQKNGDTIWTFEESYDRALTWQTFDHHYMNSLSTEELNELVSNYDTKVIAYYFDQYESFSEDVTLSYTYMDTFPYSAILQIPFETRDELKQACEQVESFLAYVKKENASYSDKQRDFDAQVNFTRNDHVFHFYTKTDSYRQLEDDFLLDAIVYADATALEDFSKDEIDACKEGMDSVIYVRSGEDDAWEQTDYYAFEHELKISSCSLYDLLTGNDETDIEIFGDRDAFTIKNDDTEYGPYRSEMISFYEVERATGIQLRCAWQVDEVNDEDAKKEVG